MYLITLDYTENHTWLNHFAEITVSHLSILDILSRYMDRCEHMGIGSNQKAITTFNARGHPSDCRYLSNKNFSNRGINLLLQPKPYTLPRVGHFICM